MSYLEELLPEFRKGAKIRRSNWHKNCCVKIDTSGKFTLDNNNKIYTIYAEELLADNWEFYKELEPDWDYIIKNKCLCWFWDKREDYKIAGILEKYFNLNNISRFIANIYEEEAGFRYCRPVRRDEVTFYEDKKDE